VEEFYVEDNEAYMYDLINARGHMGDGIRIEQGTQAKAYDIEREPLFNLQPTVATTLYEDVDDEDTKA
jgi:hypothetical protein